MLLTVGMLAMAGCATHGSPSTFTRSEAGRAQTVESGTVTAVRAVSIQNDSRGVATATGAVLGGLAGSTVGGGRGQTAATVGGAVAGGAAGNAIAGTTRAGVEVTVQLESGRTVAVVQEGSPDQFRVGDRVRVASDGVTTRVTR
ncbi:outer membrane lipoprotein [Pseudoxanthomonas sp. 10H]|uniref:glycine zipper 2TM domain-containing protein n=1 Tax=Pseudoxanthomonas sp. 10H TaxID=3242729 RepID=UPI0035574F53